MDAAIAAKSKRGISPLFGILTAVAVFFVSQFIGTLIILVYPVSRGWGFEGANSWLMDSTYAQFFLYLIIEALVVILVMLALHWREIKPAVIGLVKPKWADPLYALAGFAVYFPAFLVVYGLARAFIPSLDYGQKQQVGFENAHSAPQLVLVFVSLVILPPIAEEILCRGVLFTGVRSKAKFIPAAIVTSILFASAHLQFGSGAPLLWTAAMDTFILSMVLCFLRERTKSLWPAITLHAIKNSLAFVVLFVAR